MNFLARDPFARSGRCPPDEARDLLRHKNSNVTRAIYRGHFNDRRRELLRARLEADMEAVRKHRTAW